MNILFITNFFLGFMVSDIWLWLPRVSVFGQCPYSVTFHQSWAVSPIQYLMRQQISIVDTFVFVFVSIIKITNVFVIISISHK